MIPAPLNPEWEARKEEAKKLIAAGGCSAIKYWSNTDAIRLCPEEHKKEVHFEALECMVYISEWEDAANKAIELINRGLALIKSKKKHPPASPPAPAIEGKGEDRDWEAKEIRRRIDEQKSENSTSALIERAFVVGYFNRPDPPADYVKDVASGHLKEAWERCKSGLRLSPTPPAGAEGEGEMPEEILEWIKENEPTHVQEDGTWNAGVTALWRKMQKELTIQKQKQASLVEEIKWFRNADNKDLSAAQARITALEAELAGAIQSGRNIVDQNCALLKERDGFAVSWNTREKTLDEVVRQRDALQEEVNKWQENYSMIAATLNDRVAEVNDLKEWIDSHR